MQKAVKFYINFFILTITKLSDFISLNAQSGIDWSFRWSFLFAKTLRVVLKLVWRHDVRKFDADAILYGDTRCKKMDTSMFKRCFQRDFGWNQVKICKNTSTFFIFTTVFCRYSLFFLKGEINCWGGRDRKISALVSALVSALYMSFGSQGWTAVFDLVDTVGPNA